MKHTSNADLRRWLQLLETSSRIPTDIRPPSEDVHEVLNANFEFGRVVGSKTLPIGDLIGGVNLQDRQERLRVDQLKRKMLSPDGYISRLIVDTDGHVIEGQHRFTALQELGAQTVPVVVIQDMENHIDMRQLRQVINQAQSLHSDHVHQLIGMLLRNIAEEGSAEAVRADYDPPRGYDKAWNAALDFLIRKSG